MICGVHEIGPVVLTDVERVDPDGLGEDGLLDRVADDDVTVERLAGLVEAHVGGRSQSELQGGAEQRLLPLLEHLARIGRRTAKTSMSPGGLRPRHLIALRLLNELEERELIPPTAAATFSSCHLRARTSSLSPTPSSARSRTTCSAP